MQLTETQQSSDEVRYDPEALRKVIALASRLQDERQQTLTAEEVEQVGAEVGLDPEFVRRALAEVEARASGSRQSVTRSTGRQREKAGSAEELSSAVFSLSFPIVYAVAAFVFRHNSDLATVFTEVASAPLAVLLGFISGKSRIGLISGITLSIALAPTFVSIIPDYNQNPYVVLFAMIGGALGWFGAKQREKHFPFEAPKDLTSVRRDSVVALLNELETRLEAKRDSAGGAK